MSIQHYITAAKEEIQDKDLLTIERFKAQATRQPGLIECLEIHLKYSLLMAEAEQEFIADFLESWDASEPCEGSVLVSALRRFQTYQRMEELPEELGGGKGYFFECDEDLRKELDSYHPASRGFSWGVRIAQANIDKPNYRVPYGELGATYAEQNAEACRTLLGYCQE